MPQELNIVLCEQCQHIYSTDFIPEQGIEYVCSQCMGDWVGSHHDSSSFIFQDMGEYERSNSSISEK